MDVCRVVGDVVSTRKDPRAEGFKLLVVQQLDLATQRPDGYTLVAADTVGAGAGEVVLVVRGSSARMTQLTNERPIDAAIMGIIDYIHVEGKRVFSKYPERDLDKGS
jgi:microcompartment protein CcmK/EutM